MGPTWAARPPEVQAASRELAGLLAGDAVDPERALELLDLIGLGSEDTTPNLEGTIYEFEAGGEPDGEE
jgi:hypothetical protein